MSDNLLKLHTVLIAFSKFLSLDLPKIFLMKKIMLSAIVLVLAIGSCSKKSVPTKETAKEVAVNGAALYSGSCARCHGAEGVKDSRTPNLQTIAFV